MDNLDYNLLDQSQQEWLFARVGRITASRAKDVKSKARTNKLLKINSAALVNWEFGKTKRQESQDKAIQGYLANSQIYEKEPLLSSGAAKVFGVSESTIKTLITKEVFKEIEMEITEYEHLSQSARSYMVEILTELAKGEPTQFDNEATAWGTMHEPHARAEFVFQTGLKVKTCGLQLHSAYEEIGASLDGEIVDKPEHLEIKCPINPQRHVRCFLEGVPDEHMPQMQFQMMVTGNERCHFVSYHPEFIYGESAKFRFFHQVVERDEDYITDLMTSSVRFVKILREKKKKLNLPNFLEISDLRSDVEEFV